MKKKPVVLLSVFTTLLFLLSCVPRGASTVGVEAAGREDLLKYMPFRKLIIGGLSDPNYTYFYEDLRVTSMEQVSVGINRLVGQTAAWCVEFTWSYRQSADAPWKETSDMQYIAKYKNGDFNVPSPTVADRECVN